ncbi:MAG: DMT family transporter [Methanomassiliicoccales archaeon]|nr:DMT family transporter [Methanomassiliicoccales archaeon]
MASVKDVAAFLAMATMWALNYPLVKIALLYEGPLYILLFRLAIGALFSIAIAGGFKHVPRGLRDNALIMITGLLNSALFMGFWFLGERTESAAISSIIIYTFPIINIILSYVFLKENLTAARAVGTVVGFAGMVVIFLEQLRVGVNEGLLYLSLAAVVWSASAMVYKKYLNGRNVSAVNAMQFVYAVPFVFFWAVLGEKFNPKGLDYMFLGTMLYMGLFGSAISYLLYFHLTRKYDVSLISGFFFVVPAISVLLSFLILHETSSIFTYAGFGLISVGIFIGSYRRRSRRGTGSRYSDSLET